MASEPTIIHCYMMCGCNYLFYVHKSMTFGEKHLCVFLSQSGGSTHSQIRNGTELTVLFCYYDRDCGMN